MSAIILPSEPPSGASTPPSITIRPRRPEDFPALCDLLERQQPSSLYPIRWPLPMPVPQFIQRPGEAAAFVAECAGQILGHVAVRYGLGGPADEEELTTRWAEAHGCEEKDVRVIAVLFTDPAWAGKGVGSGLFAVATKAARAGGGRPCLDVVSTNTGPLQFYKRRGWKIVGDWQAPWVPGMRIDVHLMILPMEAANGSVAGTDSPALVPTGAQQPGTRQRA
ncbi:acyl-CoA N-acyltransferase [Cutaneotrichosporon oleaginosum]|uniref:Acyl-CoA N-acyltransferase n=1 Tax=Cutaneotrichosporon oleaginosum TaxID=879819 RepID=A0A0J0XMV4_9TREE|nr:acyl-CoA N-acyltransferase [Cutaneotrichosporon oleaginosum]KLT42423.1 acyl-CoA N-acyltransferase [Cutaneotrichosporon oleaginosum]TXT06942.1 hypothetical protein COLE_06273 [Cutaneotrichosporon oleaginosum]